MTSYSKGTKHLDHESKIQSMLTHAQRKDIKPKRTVKCSSVFDLNRPSNDAKSIRVKNSKPQPSNSDLPNSESENCQAGQEMQSSYSAQQYPAQHNIPQMEEYYTSPNPASYQHPNPGDPAFHDSQYQQAPWLQPAAKQSDDMDICQQGGIEWGESQRSSQTGYQSNGNNTNAYQHNQDQYIQKYENTSAKSSQNFQQGPQQWANNSWKSTIEEWNSQAGQYDYAQTYQQTKSTHQEHHSTSSSWDNSAPINPIEQPNPSHSSTGSFNAPQLAGKIENHQSQKHAPQQASNINKTNASNDEMVTQDEDSDRTYCEVCDVRFEKESQYWIHSRGLAHYHKVEELERSKSGTTEVKERIQKPPWQLCEPCGITFDSEKAHKDHVETSSHLLTLERYEKLKKTGEFAKAAQMAVKTESWGAADEKNLIPRGVEAWDSWFCEVCNISCTGEKNFQMHLSGSKHRKKVNRVQIMMGSKPGQTDKSEGKPVSCMERAFESCEEPIVGADYVTEYQKQNPQIEPRFACSLCESKMTLDQVMIHLTGVRHRTKYMKYHYPSNYNTLWPMKSSDKTGLALEMARDIEKREGRRKMRLRVEVAPFTLDSSSSWKEIPQEGTRDCLPGINSEGNMQSYADEADQSEESGSKKAASRQASLPDIPTLLAVKTKPSRSFDDFDWGAGASKATGQSQHGADPQHSKANPVNANKRYSQMREAEEALEGVLDEFKRKKQVTQHNIADKQFEPKADKMGELASQAQALLQNINNCVVADDKDAEAALQMSNALTQALLQYRMKSLPQEGSKSVQETYQILSETAKDLAASSGPAFSSKPPPPPHQMLQQEQGFSQPQPLPHRGNATQGGYGQNTPNTQHRYGGNQAYPPDSRAQMPNKRQYNNPASGSTMKERIKQKMSQGHKRSPLSASASLPIEQGEQKRQKMPHQGQYTTWGKPYPTEPQQHPTSRGSGFGGDSSRTEKPTSYHNKATRGKSNPGGDLKASVGGGSMMNVPARGETPQITPKAVDPPPDTGMQKQTSTSKVNYPSAKDTAKNIVAATMAAQKANKKKESLNSGSVSNNVKVRQSRFNEADSSSGHSNARAMAKSVIAATMAARKEQRKLEMEKASGSPSVVVKSAANTSTDKTPSNIKAYISKIKEKHSSHLSGTSDKPKYSVNWPSKTGTQQVAPSGQQTVVIRSTNKRTGLDPVSDDSVKKKPCSGNSPIF